MSLIPEPPQIYRSGAWRRDGLRAEPIFILGGSTYDHDCYGDSSTFIHATTGSLQIIGGEQGLIATIDAWEYQPLPDITGWDIGVEGALTAFNEWGQEMSSVIVAELVSEYESQMSTVAGFPVAFIDGDKLHILVTRQRTLLQSHTFWWGMYHMDGSGYLVTQGTHTHQGAVRGVVDALHIEVDLIDKSVTFAKQDCFSASLSLSSANRRVVFGVDFDMQGQTWSIVDFLASRTGLNASVFSVDHSPGTSWTLTEINNSYYPSPSSSGVSPLWTATNAAEINHLVFPHADMFMPWLEHARYRKEYWSDGFINWPGWLGLNREDGLILAGDLWNRVVEIAIFDPTIDQRYWGRSTLSGYIATGQLLDPEELFITEALDPNARAWLIASPMDEDFYDVSGAKQGVPVSWAENSPESVEPKYFWSNAETIKETIYPFTKMVLYRISD